MSVIIMGIVWESDLPQSEKFVLLAYADHADHEGYNVFPSIGLVAWKTGYSDRSVQRITQKLVEKGILENDGTSRYHTNRYRIVVESIPRLSPYLRGDNLTPPKYGGDILSGVTKRNGGGDKMTGEGVTKRQGGGDIAVSPEPSLTVNNKPSNVNRHIDKKPLFDDSPEGKRRKSTVEAIKRGHENQVYLEDEIRKHLRLNVTQNSTWRKVIKFLKERPEGETVAEFADWWFSKDWRGKQGQAVDANKIMELWPQAFASNEAIVAERTRNDERSRSKYSEWERVGK